MTSDEFEDLAKFLSFLKKSFPNSQFAESISENTGLNVNDVKAIIENAILNQWVDVEVRTRAGALIKINRDGNNKLNRLTDKEGSLPSENITNINVSGENINIGTGNKIAMGTDDPPPTSTNWTKWGAIFGGLGVIVAIITIAVFLSLNSDVSKNDIVTEECISGEFGLTVVNCELGFEITRANYNWVRTTDIDLFNIQQGNFEFIHPTNLGGIILAKMGQGWVTIHVADPTYFTEDTFEEFVNNFYQETKSMFPDVMIREPFFVGETVIIEMKGKFDSDPMIIVTKIEKHNERVYLFTTSFRTDMMKVDLDAFRSEQNQVIDSFNYLD